MLNIINKVGKFGADCSCIRCGAAYPVKDKYRVTPVTGLCTLCRSTIHGMQEPNQQCLLEVFNYDSSTGALTHKLTTDSGMQDESATFSHSRGYLSVCIGKKQWLAHRIIYMMVTGGWPTEHLDHINHIKHDNRWVNLRAVTQGDNNRNMPKQINTKSGVVGVSYHKPTGKYRAYITVQSKAKHLGLFDSVEAAKAARDAASVHFGYHVNHGM